MNEQRPEIPRLIHRIWLGSNPMPAEHERFGETWHEHHPGWEMRLWTDENLPASELLDGMDTTSRLAARSNLLRFEVLRQFGGVYVDTDMECLRSIEPLISGVAAFTAWEAPGLVCSAIVGGVAHHPAWERAVRDQAQRLQVGKASMPGYGRSFLTTLVEDYPDFVVFETEKFYPYGRDEKPRPASELPEAYTIHHWAWLGRGEPSDPQERAAFFEQRAAVARAGKKRYRRRSEKFEAKWRKARRDAQKAERRARKLEAKLDAVHHSRWWRLHPGRVLGQRSRSSARR